ncbi:hypothetical protein ACIOHS_48455 [Streptomyces sp. NPDC088253]|uniref:hypothetical protein n=1 Tax=Streptomyces sp. NPDC088253 TaxID=3365846 RepID=UPI003814A105
MDVSNIVDLDVHQAIDRCAELSRSGWESARLALSALDQFPLPSVEASRVKTVSMAGIYSLRLAEDGDLAERTLDLIRFTQSLKNSNEPFIRFFSVRFQDWRVLVAVSDDLAQPIAATAVRGVGADPASNRVGAMGAISVSQAMVLCEEMAEDGWEAANIAAEALGSAAHAEIPIWSANPLTLARHYSDRAKVSVESSGGPTSIDLSRFASTMAEWGDMGGFIRIFHLFDDYGWQSTCAVSEDLAQPLGVVAVKRSGN